MHHKLTVPGNQFNIANDNKTRLCIGIIKQLKYTIAGVNKQDSSFPGASLFPSASPRVIGLFLGNRNLAISLNHYGTVDLNCKYSKQQENKTRKCKQNKISPLASNRKESHEDRKKNFSRVQGEQEVIENHYKHFNIGCKSCQMINVY